MRIILLCNLEVCISPCVPVIVHVKSISKVRFKLTQNYNFSFGTQTLIRFFSPVDLANHVLQIAIDLPGFIFYLRSELLLKLLGDPLRAFAPVIFKQKPGTWL